MITLPFPDDYAYGVEFDLPWDGREKGCRGFAGVEGYDVNAASQYETMTLEEIAAFGHTQIKRVARDPAHFWMWTIELFLDDALDLLKEWGLYRKRTHIWVKTTDKIPRRLKGLERFKKEQLALAMEVLEACGITGKPNAKTGYWGKLGHEYLILATNSHSFPTLNRKHEPSVFFAPVPNGTKNKHSYKPKEAYDLIRRNSPGPRISLFQRHQREGFECWGNQLEAADG